MWAAGPIDVSSSENSIKQQTIPELQHELLDHTVKMEAVVKSRVYETKKISWRQIHFIGHDPTQFRMCQTRIRSYRQ
jgi:hypothetical protein